MRLERKEQARRLSNAYVGCMQEYLYRLVYMAKNEGREFVFFDELTTANHNATQQVERIANAEDLDYDYYLETGYEHDLAYCKRDFATYTSIWAVRPERRTNDLVA